MAVTTATNLDYLITPLRQEIGDTDETSYRYIDDWLQTALITSVKALQRWWRDKYILDGSNNVTTGILDRDERPIILMAGILVRSGQLEANSWSVGSWRDAEYAVSNIEGNKAKQTGLQLAWQELLMYMLPPSKKLAIPRRDLIPGVDE